jgi:hypothetical protein
MKWPADKIERRPIAQLILYAAECAYKKNIPQKYFGWPSHKLFRARINYIAGCDASGGRNDSFTAAISHRERDGKIVLDVLYETAFSIPR